MHRHPFKDNPWLLAIRPKTLFAAVSPVLIGTTMAVGDGIQHLPTAFLCLLGALSIQIATNLANDYFDFKKGVDNSERVGPRRAMQAGLIKPSAMMSAIIVSFSFSAVIAYWLFLRGGWPIAMIGILGILSGIFYTAGPKPLGYLGLGDIWVFIFFGPVAVAGTYYAQSLEINMAVVLAGFAPGLISAGILTINNLRDMETDKKYGKKTLAVRFGREFAQTEYLTAILGAAFIPILIFLLIDDHAPILMSSTLGLMAIPVFKTILTQNDGPSLNEALAFTGKLLFIYSILFSLGWIL